MTFPYKTALIVGGSRGVGRDIAKRLSAEGVRAFAIARNSNDLAVLKRETPSIETMALDASVDGVAAKLMTDLLPDLLILAGGHAPKMQPMSAFTWQEFSAAWNTDTKIAFEFTKAALLAPLIKGSAIVSFSSGAALGGSALSGGYAGAKKMQHFISNYGKWEAERLGLGLNFYTIYPRQLIAGTAIGHAASSAYADAASISQETFMSQWEKPLTPNIIGGYVIGLLKDESRKPGAYSVTGTAMEALA